MEIVMSLVVIGGLGLVFGGFLAVAAKRFEVEEDPRVETICDLLPGANCGACGFPGCVSFAEKLVSGEAAVDCCVPGGKGVCDNICEVLGVASVASGAKKVAEIFCIGSEDVAPNRFEYHGVQDCKAAMMYGGGFKTCTYGCLGLGNCVHVCPFDAMSMGDNGLPVADVERCTGCGICVKACPRSIIRIVDANSVGMAVRCSSQDRGKVTRDVCEVGCIACKACVKACPNEAVVVENNLAIIDPEKCNGCGECVDKCKREGLIRKISQKVTVS